MTREPIDLAPRTQRSYVDFNYVEPKHAEIDQRLVNWARWFADRDGRFQSPMFRMYRSTDVWRHQQGEVKPVDGADAARLQIAVTKLPEVHRLALSWAYIRRDNPRRAAAELGHTLEGLAHLIRDGRQMLVNRGV